MVQENGKDIKLIGLEKHSPTSREGLGSSLRGESQKIPPR